ncbi:FG-GAP-like repeat-containing protein [Marinilabilia salmonicolor]|uniref:FG-GAP-like repeat-containing protein n=1 Tax=Marinilabilia salmonicolor TaxID=989 RepID=UPI000A8D4BBC|nr:FG-GAP-like repeat-containing protein [Marinilabilia salmonicolor]
MKTISTTTQTRKLYQRLQLMMLFFVLATSTVFSQLSGTYNIGDAQDYPDVQSAVTDLNTNGVSGPVTFNILPGTYDVHVTINHITGSSATNTVTYQSSTQDSTDVILEYDAVGLDDNWIFLLDGPDHLSFKHLTFRAKGENFYNTIILFDGFSSYVTFSNNAFYGQYSGGGATARETIIRADVENFNNEFFGYLNFTHNYFLKGSYGLYLEGLNDHHLPGTLVDNNTFEETGYCSTYCNFNYAPIITYNNMEAGSYGLRVSGDYGGGTYSGNKINSENWGMEIRRLGDEGGRALIANNFVTIGENGNQGISIGNSVFTDVLNNSVYVLSKSFQASAFHAAGGVNSFPTVTVKNNNFSCEDKAYAVEVLTENVIGEMSNNNLYTAGNYIANWAQNKVFDINELQDLTGLNQNSLSVYPHYLSERDLHTIAPWLDGKGTILSLVTDDIDGEIRSGTPDIGADEFTPAPVSTIPLDGASEYTIGSGGTYPDFETAMADALLRGISASVTFGFLEGTYDDQFVMKSIPGSSDLNRVTIQSATANEDTALLTYSAQGLDDNFVFWLHGADFVTLKNLKLSAEGTQYGRVVNLYQGADSIIVENCWLASTRNTNATGNIVGIFSGDSDFRSRIIRNNHIRGSAFGLYMRRDQNNFLYPTGTIIQDNDFINVGYSAMYLQFYESPQINGNIIESNTKGIQALSCSNDLRILKNKINVNGDGVTLSTCYGTEEHKGLIANNFIHCGGASGVDGIYINNSPWQLIFNNSVNVTSPNSNSRPLYITSGGSTSATLFNNIFSNIGGGRAIYITTPSTVFNSDYNAYYVTDDNLAYWGENVVTLEDLQPLNSMDAHSIFGDPHFFSDSDLHANAQILDSAAVSLAAVPDDIDGEPRDLTYPDIGADEFVKTEDFTLLATNLPGLSHGAIKWGDYDNDGDMDLLQTGWIGDTDQFRTKIITNTGAGFEDSGIALTGLSGSTSCSADWIDMDNDNDLDIIATGRLDGDEQNKKTVLYRNDEGGFSLLEETGIEDVSSSCVKWADMDRDGTYDLLLSGRGATRDYNQIYLNSGGSFTASPFFLGPTQGGETSLVDIDKDGDVDIFTCGSNFNPCAFHINNGDVTFTKMDTEIPEMTNASVDWVDMDNDGDLDVAVMGKIENDPVLRIYRNEGMPTNGGTWFSLVDNFTGTESGDLAWADYDNDGDVDLVVTGNHAGYQPSTIILVNDQAVLPKPVTTWCHLDAVPGLG